MLIACEYSGKVRDAFLRLGHDAISCDVLPTDSPGPHYIGDVRDLLTEQWDLIIAHPPCTMLTRAGARWWKGREQEQQEALDFVLELMNADAPMIAIENPPGAIGTRIRKADQYIQPWEHGHTEKKMTGLWLKGLPKLQPTKDVKKEMMALPKKEQNKCHYAAPGPERWKVRSTTYQGIADAMAIQWGSLPTKKEGNSPAQLGLPGF